MRTIPIPTVPIDEEMMRMGERDMQEDYEKFVQAGIAQYLKERAEQKPRDEKTEPRRQESGVRN